MGAVENDFSCAGMCGKSYLYTFSDVRKGPPPQNCSQALNDFVETAATKAVRWFYTYFFITFVCALYMCLLWKKQHNHLDSPLLK
jgi:hypothetical protein